MSSIALQRSAVPTPLVPEADLARSAARGDAPAVAELVRRHGLPAWRLAAAVCAGPARATRAVADGYSRALRDLRRRKASPDHLRTHILAGVYGAALDQVREDHGGPAPVETDGPVQSAFVSLPERWRAALWLREVEGFEPEGIGAVLGVAPAMAEQLASRGRRGLAGRLAPFGEAVPSDLAAALGGVAGNLPANLADRVTAAWELTLADPAVRFAPLVGPFGERTQRVLGVAAGGLLAIGLVGLGVLGQAALGPSNPPVASGSTSADGALGVPGGAVNASMHSGRAAGLSGSYGSPVAGLTLAGTLTALGGSPAVTVSSLSTSTPSGFGGPAPATTGSHHGGGSATRHGRAPTGGSHHTGGSGRTGSHHSGGSGSSGGTSPTTTTVVSVPGVVAVSSGGGTTTVSVGSGSGPSVSATVCPDGVSLSALGITSLSQCPTTTTTTAPPPTTTTTVPSQSSGSGNSGSGNSGSGNSGSGGNPITRIIGGLGL